MPVDKTILNACIGEAAGDDAVFATTLREKLEKDDAAAARFVSGFLRNRDYTEKTSALASERKTMEASAAQTEALRQRLEVAESEKTKIMKDLAAQKLTVAAANARLQNVKEMYQLDDDDIPPMGDLIQTRKSGKVQDDTPTVEERLTALMADFEKKLDQRLATALTPELSSMAIMPAIWSRLESEHRELTGKDLSFKEKQEILAQATANKTSLVDAWESKFGIADRDGEEGLRTKSRTAAVIKSERAKWDKEQADARSKAALEVVAPHGAEVFSGDGASAVFGTEFRQFPMDPNVQPGTVVQKAGESPTIPVPAGAHVRQPAGQRVPAAQRAAQKFVEKGGVGGYRKTA